MCSSSFWQKARRRGRAKVVSMVLHPPFKRSPEDCGSFLSFGEGRCPAEHLTGLVFWVEAAEAASQAGGCCPPRFSKGCVVLRLRRIMVQALSAGSSCSTFSQQDRMTESCGSSSSALNPSPKALISRSRASCVSSSSDSFKSRRRLRVRSMAMA